MSVPLKRNTAGQHDYVMLFKGADTVTTPPIVAGDFKVSVDDGAEANPTTLPAESPAGSGWVKWSPSQAETNGAVIKLRWRDQAGAAFDDGGATWRTSATVLTDLPTSAAAAAATASAGEILILRGDTMDQDITDLGDVSTRTELWFTVKQQTDDLDADAILLISEGTGLEVLNGVDTTIAPIRIAEATITVTDAVAGDITIWVNPTATDELVPNPRLHYDIQWTDGTDVHTVALGRCRVAADVTRTVT